ncbi:MAG: hypothetical protein GX954_07650 [Clostridium cochlearium]|nr:hypothetical protein [Clostridium cochlearium]
MDSVIKIKISRNKIIIAGIGIISIAVLIFAIIIFRSNLKLTEELQLIKEGDINNQIDDELNAISDEAEETTENDGDTKETIKNTMIKNIQEKSERNIKEIMEWETIKGGDSITLAGTTDNIINKLLDFFIVFLAGMEKISGYLALIFIIVGSVGTALSGKAPFVKKGFIGLIVLGPVIFIISNYGPALLKLL